MHDGQFSVPSNETMAHGTIQNTISIVLQTFWENGQADPTKDNNGKTGCLLQQQLGAYRNKAPPLKQQKAFSCCILTELAQLDITELQQATVHQDRQLCHVEVFGEPN